MPNREGKKVAKRQGEVVRDLCSVLRRMPGKGLSRDTDAVDLLERLLDVDRAVPAGGAEGAAAARAHQSRQSQSQPSVRKRVRARQGKVTAW